MSDVYVMGIDMIRFGRFAASSKERVRPKTCFAIDVKNATKKSES